MPKMSSICSFLACHTRRSVDVVHQDENQQAKQISNYPAIQVTSFEMSDSLAFLDKVVIVTGSSGGIGADAVKHFAQQGAKVVVNGRNLQTMTSVAAECDSLSPRKYKCLPIRADVSKEEDCKRLIECTVGHFGRIDVLVNNAGSGTMSSIYDSELLNKFNQMLNINLLSVVRLTQLAAPHLEKTKGCIINISSSLSLKPYHSFVPYATAKAALDTFTKCTALELGPKGIRANTIQYVDGLTFDQTLTFDLSPTATRTNFQTAAGGGENIEGVLQHLEKAIPLGRLGNTKDIVGAIAFLASPAAAFITGTHMPVDGASILI